MKNSSLFYLSIQSDLSASDFKVLSLLYQPLLGMEAHSLYVTFYQLANKSEPKEIIHSDLFDLLNLKQTDFLKMRNRLEALNLLTVYQKDDAYVYFMKAPLSAKQFLVDTVFGSYLQSEIGEKQTTNLLNLFKIELPDTKEYTNITKTFDQLYAFKTLSLLNVDYDLVGRQQNGGSRLNYQFDYEGFVDGLPERLKNSQLLNEKLKQQITRIAFVYQYNISDMQEIYIDAAKDKQYVNFNQLNMKARLYLQNKNKEIKIEETEISEVTTMSRITPQVIIQKYGKQEQLPYALATATSLLERNHVEMGVVNVMLMFILKHKEGVLPNLTYLEKVLHDWLNKGVSTTEDAISYAQSIEDRFQKASGRNSNNKKVSNEPDWLESYLKEVANMEG